MIYSNNLLVVGILLENTSQRKIFGVFRPSAYMKETGTFFTTARIDLFKKEIEPKESIVIPAILESPAGFGHNLKNGAVLSLRSGLDEIGKAIILEIQGYTSDMQDVT